MSAFKMTPLLWGMILLVLFAKPTHAFGAGNIAGISKVEGQNWRHGDIEDTLLKIIMARAVGGKKFDKLMVSRTYFGNWLRDYSQAIDVGTVKSVSAEAIRLLLCILGFLTFGFGSREFEVTAERLGCYRPEDHIDNPKNYADNEDARQYDRRLRGPIDERVELAIDEETGMKNYIANERVNIMTSALHVRRLFTKCIELGRRYSQDERKEDLYEALRLMGTGLHCLEDFLAHSNYCELALIEMGERDVFPHVGRNTRMRLQGARDEVYPIVTGTFGGVDFLHSVTGEVSDKLTQNEIEELEGTLQQSSQGDTSILRNLLDKIPSGLFGGDDKKSKMEELQNNANAAQMQQTSISPRDPEEYTLYIRNIFQQIMPAIEFHDEIIQKISEQIEKIPILPKIIEQLEDQLSVFVFSLIAPFIVPVISQIKNELRTGSDEIIESSNNEQHIVFNDDESTDPTHSMLSKDHFSNILNEVAGRTASKVVAWVVPQLMDAIDNPSTDIDRTMNRIISGVLHHPAQRDQGEDGAREGRALMFESVQEWWSSVDQDDYRRKLSRSGVQRGENHKEGVQDTGHGHGCAGKLGMHKQFGGGSSEPQTMEDKIASQAAGAIVGGLTSGFSDLLNESTGGKVNFPTSENPTQGGGLLGAASSLLSGFSAGETDTYESRPERQSDGGITQRIEQYGRSSDGRRFEQAELTDTRYADGRETQEFQRYEQRDDGHGREQGFGYEERQERHGGGGFQRTEERTWEGGDSFQQRDEGRHHGGGHGGREGGGFGGGRREDPERQEYGGYGGGRRDEPERQEYGGGYGGGRRDEPERQEYGGYGGGRRDEPERQEYGGGFGGGRRDEPEREEYGGGYGGGRRDEPERQEYGGYGGGRRDEPERQEYGGGFGGGRRDEPEREEYGGGYGGGRRDEPEREEYGGGYGGGRRDNDDEDEERREGGGNWGERRRSRSRDRNEGGGGWFS
ncbi:hypothetical protein N0V93_001520 [Gnomoniopsis smithogilvyi]|uniref:Uncharacterized protein n=1 Tax=Gnomoniopsis smithogilvyi TaxID=1191159 RepID=A0A9W9D2T0_9PEZI|nr:hypothetical protein N0V93_001520 [Gnomoniopsis smithogilvyi]